MLICTNCNKEYETGKFCTECGTPLKEKPKDNACPKCGTTIGTPSKFCPECGAKLVPEAKASSEAELTAKYFDLRQLYNDNKYDEALILAKELADFGDARGQNLLGIMFKEGKGVDKNIDQAVDWFKKAAEQGLDKAQANLGRLYLFEKNDDKQAAYWLKKAAEQFSDNGQFWYGYCCYYGFGVDQNFNEAFIWLKKAADQNYHDAFYLLGKCYYNGTGVEKDFKKAVECFEKGSHIGGAQTMLGDCYYFGNGVAQDYRQAVEWYRKAAEKDDDYAQYSLGYCYKEGQGLSQDDKMAKYWFKKAAENGNEDAKKELEEKENNDLDQVDEESENQDSSINNNIDSNGSILLDVVKNMYKLL